MISAEQIATSTEVAETKKTNALLADDLRVVRKKVEDLERKNKLLTGTLAFTEKAKGEYKESYAASEDANASLRGELIDAQADGEHHRLRAEEFLSWADAARKRLEENERQKTSLTATNNDLRLYSDGLLWEVDESKIAGDRNLKKSTRSDS